MKPKRIALLFVSIALIVTSALFAAPSAAEAKAGVDIEEFEVRGYGKSFKVKLTNMTKRAITVSGPLKFKIETYKYVGYDEGDEDGFDIISRVRTLKFRPKKTVRINPGMTKWVYYKKITPGRYLFEDEVYARVSVRYQYKGRKKTVSRRFEFEAY